MKRINENVYKSKKPSLDSIPGTATSASTLMTSTTDLDLMPSIPATTSDTTASAQATAGINVSVQPRLSQIKY